MINKKRLFLYLTLTFGIVLLINSSIFINRSVRSFHRQKVNYSTLYYPDHLARIQGFDILEREKVKLLVTGQHAEEWVIITDGIIQSHTKIYPVIDVQKYLQQYRVRPINDPSPSSELVFSLGFSPSEYYQDAGLSIPDLYELTAPSAPIGRFKQYPLEKFTLSKDDFSLDEVDQATKLFHEEGIDITASTLEKMEAIGTLLLTHLDDKRGIPTNDMQAATPWQQYRYAMEGHSKCWCGNFAKIYHFFATVAGIPTRVVAVGGTIDGINLSGHGFCESFVRESNEWAYVDLTTRKIYVKNEEGALMNAVDIFHIIKSKTLDSLVAKYFDGTRLVDRPYRDAEYEAEAYYFSKDTEFRFIYPARRVAPTLLEKARRYYSQKILIYSLKELQGNNMQHYVKMGALSALVVCGALWFIVGLALFKVP